MGLTYEEIEETRRWEEEQDIRRENEEYERQADLW